MISLYKPSSLYISNSFHFLINLFLVFFNLSKIIARILVAYIELRRKPSNDEKTELNEKNTIFYLKGKTFTKDVLFLNRLKTAFLNHEQIRRLFPHSHLTFSLKTVLG